MRVLITGAAGFTGRYLGQLLIEAGHEAIGLAQSGESVPYASQVFFGDLGDAAWLREVVCEVRPEAVVHLAAISFVAHDDADEIYRNNLLGTRHLLEALACIGTCRSVLLASSANIYGNASEGVLTEDTCPAPANDYAVSKLAMEYVARLYKDRLPIIIARPFNYTGVGQAESFLLPKIVGHFKRRAPVIELGNLEVTRDFSDVRVVADCYRRLLDCPAAVGQAFNICSGRAVSLAHVMDTMRSLSGHEMEVRVNPAFVRRNEVRVLLGSRARLESVVGRVNDIPIEQTLQWMLEA
jgi:nucleoside-diphosphate-sugar epimerase